MSKSVSTPDLFDLSDLGFDDPELSSLDFKAPLWEPKAWEPKTGTIQLKRTPDSFENSVGAMKNSPLNGTQPVSAQPLIRQWAQRIDQAADDLHRVQELRKGELKRSLLHANSQLKNMTKEVENVTRERDVLRRQVEDLIRRDQVRSKELEDARELANVYQQKSQLLSDQLSDARSMPGDSDDAYLVQAWQEECLALGDQLVQAKQEQNSTLKRIGELDKALEGLRIGAVTAEESSPSKSLDVDPELDKQATKIQATFRGKKTRKEVSIKRQARPQQQGDSQKQQVTGRNKDKDRIAKQKQPKPTARDQAEPQELLEARQQMVEALHESVAVRVQQIKQIYASGNTVLRIYGAGKSNAKLESPPSPITPAAADKRKEEELLRKQREAAEEEAAAIRIQSVQRSKKARREVQQRKIAKAKSKPVTAPIEVESADARMQREAAEEAAAAVRIQSVHRSKAARKEVQQKRIARAKSTPVKEPVEFFSTNASKQPEAAEVDKVVPRLEQLEQTEAEPRLLVTPVAVAETDDVIQFLARARAPEWDVVRVAGLAVAENRDKVQLSEVQVDANLELLRLRSLEPVGPPREIPLRSVVGVSQDTDSGSCQVHVKLGDPRSVEASTSQLHFTVRSTSARRELVTALEALGTSMGCAPEHIQPGEVLGTPSVSDGPTPRLLRRSDE
jgi:hypothetical protein